MSYKQDIEKCIAYMEANLDRRVPVIELADYLGYSLYHFCRVFKSICGVSAGAFLRELQLDRAAKLILDGESVTDAAMVSGFDTPSGFTRAFIRRFGCSPSEYLRKGRFMMMKAEIKKMDAFTAVGYCLAPPEGEVDVLDNSAYWLGKDFSGVSKEDYQKLTYPGFAEIGAWMHPDDVSGELYYFFGPIVKDKNFIPDGMEAIDVPAAEYAVFTVPAAKNPEELNENIRKTWKYIFAEWFDNSEYKFNEAKMDFEYYQGENTYIYVPVIKK